MNVHTNHTHLSSNNLSPCVISADFVQTQSNTYSQPTFMFSSTFTSEQVKACPLHSQQSIIRTASSIPAVTMAIAGPRASHCQRGVFMLQSVSTALGCFTAVHTHTHTSMQCICQIRIPNSTHKKQLCFKPIMCVEVDSQLNFMQQKVTAKKCNTWP